MIVVYRRFICSCKVSDVWHFWCFVMFEFFFFARWVPIGTPGLRPAGPLPYTSHLNSKGYLGIQPPYRGPQFHSASPLLFVLDPSWQNPRSASIPFPTPCIRIEYVPMFPFLHCISYIRESLLPSSCAACTADWYARLGALPTFSMFPIQFTYELNIPICWSLQTQLASPISQTFHSVCNVWNYQYIVTP